MGVGVFGITLSRSVAGPIASRLCACMQVRHVPGCPYGTCRGVLMGLGPGALERRIFGAVFWIEWPFFLLC